MTPRAADASQSAAFAEDCGAPLTTDQRPVRRFAFPSREDNKSMNDHGTPQRRVGRRMAAASASLAVLLAGCAVTPQPYTSEDIARRVADDNQKMYAGQDPITGPVTLGEASARAIRYNLDYRLRLLETALAQGQLDVAQWDMFPRLLLNAGYVHRNNDLVYVNAAGVPSTTTLERSRRLASAEFSWNVLDFGVSYYRAKMQADQALIAEERKRKVIQNLMQDVRIAYWRALGAQRLLGQMDTLMQKSRTALGRARQVEQQGLLPQAQALAYQRALLDSTTLLQARRQDLELAKMELAALMNLPPGTQFTLAEMPDPELPAVPNDVPRLEELALTQRPELREEDYRRRISASDARRALTTALPGLSLDVGSYYDSNRYLLNNTWVESGLRLTMNLFRLASIPTLNRARDAQFAVDDTRRMAQAMAVLTQVRVAALRYGLAKDELEQVLESASVDQRLANYAKAAATSRVDSELEVIRTEARALLSNYQRHIAYANAQAAYGRLNNSVGLDVQPPPPGADLKTIQQAVEQSMSEWQRTTFSTPRAAGITPPIRIVLEGVRDPAIAAAVRAGVTDALSRHHITVTDEGDAWHLVVGIESAPAKGEELTRWRMVMFRPNGVRVGSVSYASSMPGKADATRLEHLVQAAVELHAVTLADWLVDSTRSFAQRDEDIGALH